MKIVLVTGGFDPIHSGHLAYFKAARTLGDRLVVGLNSDEWLTRKKGRPFMPLHERMAVVGNLVMVDEVVTYNDDDGSSAEAIRAVRSLYPDADIVFANGGDRTPKNIPEMSVQDSCLTFAFGVGGEDKRNSSSWILQEWKAPKTERPWGYYRVLHDVPGMKVKELTVNPGASLSMQRHWLRSEYWIVQDGVAVVNGIDRAPKTLYKYQEHHVPHLEWHQLTNPFSVPLKIVEIQYGERCVEEDIERQCEPYPYSSDTIPEKPLLTTPVSTASSDMPVNR
jgi:cytidyltransferase-like protein